MYRLLQEVAGRVFLKNLPQNYSRVPNKLQYIRERPTPDRPSYTKSLKGYQDLDGWQQYLYRMVVNGQDVLVNVNPAGGKTKPIVFAWQDTFNNTGNHSKILWVTPTVQLANQVFHVDLKEALLERIKSWTTGHNSTFPTRILPPEIQVAIARSGGNYANEINLTVDEINVLNDWLMGTAMVLRAGSAGSGGGIGKISSNTIAAVCTYSFAKDMLSTQKPEIVVIDELQEYVPIEPKQDDDSTKKASEFIGLLNNIPRHSTLVLLTGSMNEQTSNEIIKFINSYFGRKLKLFHVGSDLASNRASIVITPHTKMRTAEDRISIIKQAIHSRDPGNAMILFSSKNTDPEYIMKNAIFPIAKRLTLELAPRSIEQVCGTTPNRDPNTARTPIMTHPNSMYPEELDHMSLDNATNRIKGRLEDPKYMASYLNFMLHQPNPEPVYNMKSDRKPNKPDPFLAKCILCGFGYLANSSLKSFRMYNEDIMLVQNLFKMGKIYFLLASDMIGVGTTLTIRKLYLPSLDKFKGGGLPYGEIDSSSLVQLINRVGRQTNVAASIYCNPSDYTTISRLLRNDPMSEVQPALFGNGDSNIERSIDIIDRAKIILNMIRSPFS